MMIVLFGWTLMPVAPVQWCTKCNASYWQGRVAGYRSGIKSRNKEVAGLKRTIRESSEAKKMWRNKALGRTSCAPKPQDEI